MQLPPLLSHTLMKPLGQLSVVGGVVVVLLVPPVGGSTGGVIMTIFSIQGHLDLSEHVLCHPGKQQSVNIESSDPPVVAVAEPSPEPEPEAVALSPEAAALPDPEPSPEADADPPLLPVSAEQDGEPNVELVESIIFLQEQGQKHYLPHIVNF